MTPQEIRVEALKAAVAAGAPRKEVLFLAHQFETYIKGNTK